ncbi:MAG: pantetheine-phosphate adenylyltransferase [Opitutales bacterium]
MKTAIYPGSFDPITNGHLDVIQRACKLFDRVIVGVATGSAKHPIFPVEQRVALIRENLEGNAAVEVQAFQGLVVDFARKIRAVALIRGLRAVSDFEYEFQMMQMNRHLDPGIETIFMMPNEKYFFTSSTLIKQVFRYTDRDTQFVPANVHAALRAHFQGKDDA